VPQNEKKRARLRALANERGVIAALAIDQRLSMRKMLASAAGVAAGAIAGERLAEFKETVVRHLTPHASAVLIDPEFGLRAAAARAAPCGLLLTYESDGFENPRPHRMLQLIPEYSVRRLGDLGAQGIKILLSWAPDDDPAANDRKRVMIERIGAECDAHSIPFFLEPVVYDPAGTSPHDPAFLARKPERVRRTMAEVSGSRYLVDVLKVEFPVGALAVRNGVFTREQALDWFRRADACAQVPYIYLSAGVPNDEFTASLTLAVESGASFSGVLCGRANWQDGVGPYVRGGTAALSEWLATEGVRNMACVNQALAGAVAVV
jgi:tagatose 1,6-diphosphate aldolase